MAKNEKKEIRKTSFPLFPCEKKVQGKGGNNYYEEYLQAHNPY